MTSCLVIAAVITCTGLPPKPTPSEAVKVLTASVQPYVAPWPRAERTTQDVNAATTFSQFTTPATPIKPLSDPWRVTTVFTRHHGVETYFNGILIR